LLYEESSLPTASRQFNGNIGGQKWRSASDNTLRQYTYQYDASNRLTKAVYAGGIGGELLDHGL
jgi:hypothetical protein